jgi:hypothetical protein
MNIFTKIYFSHQHAKHKIETSFFSQRVLPKRREGIFEEEGGKENAPPSADRCAF